MLTHMLVWFSSFACPFMVECCFLFVGLLVHFFIFIFIMLPFPPYMESVPSYVIFEFVLASDCFSLMLRLLIAVVSSSIITFDLRNCLAKCDSLSSVVF